MNCMRMTNGRGGLCMRGESQGSVLGKSAPLQCLSHGDREREIGIKRRLSAPKIGESPGDGPGPLLCWDKAKGLLWLLWDTNLWCLLVHSPDTPAQDVVIQFQQPDTPWSPKFPKLELEEPLCRAGVPGRRMLEGLAHYGREQIMSLHGFCLGGC